MAEVCSVVLVEVAEREVDDIIHYVDEGEGQNQQSPISLLITYSHIHSQPHPIQHRHKNIHLINAVFLEFILEFTELPLICCL